MVACHYTAARWKVLLPTPYLDHNQPFQLNHQLNQMMGALELGFHQPCTLHFSTSFNYILKLSFQSSIFHLHMWSSHLINLSSFFSSSSIFLYNNAATLSSSLDDLLFRWLFFSVFTFRPTLINSITPTMTIWISTYHSYFYTISNIIHHWFYCNGYVVYIATTTLGGSKTWLDSSNRHDISYSPI